MPDGSEEVLTKKSFTGISSPTTEEISGTVQVNPVIDGATVKAIDSDGNILSTTTDTNGEYTINKKPSVVDKIVVNVEGFSSEATSNPLYTTASLKANSVLLMLISMKRLHSHKHLMVIVLA